MFKFFGILFFAFVPLLASAQDAGEKWYQGGTLHKSTVAEWKSASAWNRRATAADWAMNTKRVQAIVFKAGNVDVAKPYAVELARCVDIAVSDDATGKLDSINVAEIAVGCVILMKWEINILNPSP